MSGKSPIKDVLTIVDLAGVGPSARVTADLAAKVGAHVTALAPVVEPVSAAYLATPIPAEILMEASDTAETRAKTAAAAVDQFLRTSGVSSEPELFSVVDGAANSLIARARLADLAIVGQLEPSTEEPMREALIEALLFETTVPMLLVPYIDTVTFSARHVAIAWDGSKTAARAVRALVGLLDLVEKITVVVGDKGRNLDEDPGADVALHLARHGKPVTVSRIPSPGGDVAAAILNFVSDNGIDMVVMGGYGHSRFREFILGGATRGMLDSMTVPVLMAH